jgi:TonB family protein
MLFYKKQNETYWDSLLPESDEKIMKYTGSFLFLGIAASFWFSTIEFIIDEIAFVDGLFKQDISSIVLEKTSMKKKLEMEEKKVTQNKKKNSATGGPQRGKGQPDVPQSRGVLKLLATKSSNSGLSVYSLMNDQNFRKDIDKVLSQVGGLKQTGRTELGGRRGRTDAGLNQGYTEGGSGGISDILGGLIGGGSGPVGPIAHLVRPPSAADIDMGGDGGARSKASIMSVVRARSPGLRHVYTKYLRSEPGFGGKVTLRFTIAPKGDIIAISVVGTTTGNFDFDKEIMGRVKAWKFEEIKSGNTTVTIPFTFSE